MYKYKRIVGEITTVNINVNDELLRIGYAVKYGDNFFIRELFKMEKETPLMPNLDGEKK